MTALHRANARIAELEKELGEAKAWLRREAELHQSALDQLTKINTLVTHDGCGNTYARISAEVGILRRKIETI